jgi:CheY-like chemotaxis protein
MAETTTRPNLLLVEDDADTLEVFSILLGDRYAVSAYRSPLEALRGLDAVRPDLLILDIGMYPIDGVECLRKIRATPGHADVPAVALTGYARDDERARFLARGFQAVVVKPILEPADLIAVIDGLLVRSTPVRRYDALSPSMADLDAQSSMSKCAARGASETGRGRPA